MSTNLLVGENGCVPSRSGSGSSMGWPRVSVSRKPTSPERRHTVTSLLTNRSGQSCQTKMATLSAPIPSASPCAILTRWISNYTVASPCTRSVRRRLLASLSPQIQILQSPTLQTLLPLSLTPLTYQSAGSTHPPRPPHSAHPTMPTLDFTSFLGRLTYPLFLCPAHRPPSCRHLRHSGNQLHPPMFPRTHRLTQQCFCLLCQIYVQPPDHQALSWRSQSLLRARRTRLT